MLVVFRVLILVKILLLVFCRDLWEGVGVLVESSIFFILLLLRVVWFSLI